MGIFQGKTYRHLITGVTYAAFSFLAASSPNYVVQSPQDNRQGIENIIPLEDPANKLEKELLKKQQKPPEKPQDKYGPQWQEEIRRNYRTELV